MSHWQKHFQYYDQFQMSNQKYLALLDFLAESVEDCNNILDSGSGTGNLTKILIDQNHLVTALDNNKFALNILKKKVQSPKLTITKFDLNKDLPFEDNSFNAVISSLVLPYVKNFEHYFSEHYRVLTNGGVLAFSILLPVTGIMDNILESIESDKIEKQLIHDHPDWWAEIEKSSRVNEKHIMRNGKTEKEITKLLNAAGFKNIKKMSNNPYNRYVLIGRCDK